MSKSKARAIIDFNKKFNRNTIKIPCNLHVIHIIITIFNNIIFDKINSLLDHSLNFHLFNIINLAYHLYNRYNESNKDNL